jgi:NAD(P)-dependent dehydrogenase (short-subunit alcohol dehydrogenase family)
MPVYIASKHAVLGLTKSAALEYAKSGIRINAVASGRVETDMLHQTVGEKHQLLIPIGHTGNPEEIANAWSGYCLTKPLLFWAIHCSLMGE